jgi:glycosyltransferase involved in cell wall biosynthesis
VYCNENRLGFGDNFLRAASLCKGEYIAFCDQDDAWLAVKLATCAQAFTDPDVLLVIHAARVTGPDLRPTGVFYPNIKQRRIFAPLLGAAWQNTPGFAIVFRSLLMGLTDFKMRPHNSDGDPQKRIPMSHDQWVFFLSQSLGKTVFIETPLANYRNHGANTCGPTRSRSWQEKLADSIHTTASRYTYLAEISGQYVTVLSKLEKNESIPFDFSLRAKCAQHYWEWQGCNLHHRAIIYADSSTITRLHSFISLLAVGAYRPPERGGFGLRGLAKDITFGLLGILSG